MNTVLVWLLIALPVPQYRNSDAFGQVTVVERFATVEECTRVAKVIRETPSYWGETTRTNFRCVQATIVETRK